MHRNGNTPRISLPDRWQWDDERLQAAARVVVVIEDAQEVIREHEELLIDPNESTEVDMLSTPSGVVRLLRETADKIEEMTG